MKNLKLREQKLIFDQLILNSINNTHIIPDSVYFDEAYYEQLTKELKNKQLYEKYLTKELNEISPGFIKMCSVASSSRLCFLYFAGDNNATMEVSLNTGTKGNAQLDAAKGNTYYECKCHEIFDNHDTDKNHLKLSYKKNLKKYFGINYQEKDENYCKLTLRDFGIPKNMSIYDLRFDMKQFLCHLFGIAKNGGGTLQYIFFQPKKELMEKKSFCTEIYKKLEDEISAIWNSEIIKNMCNNNKIELPKSKMVDVSTITDIVLQNII